MCSAGGEFKHQCYNECKWHYNAMDRNEIYNFNFKEMYMRIFARILSFSRHVPTLKLGVIIKTILDKKHTIELKNTAPHLVAIEETINFTFFKAQLLVV